MEFLLTEVMRSLHILAAGIWVGGSVVYLLVITPALRLAKADPRLSGQMGDLFRRLVNLCMGTLLFTGVYLIFDRLSSSSIGAVYISVLVLKIAVSLSMMVLALVQAQEARRNAARRGKLYRALPRWILGLGILALALGVALTGIFEAGIQVGIGR